MGSRFTPTRSCRPRASAIIAIVTLVAVSSANAAPPAAGSPPDVEQGVSLLANVKDGEFSFDDEGFYWFCRFLREHPDVLERPDCATDEVVPWQYLMERPSDYRGRAICIEGRFLGEQPPYDVTARPGVGRLRQVDLGVPGSQAIATLVLVDPPPATPKRSLVRARGYFIKVRSYRTESGGEGAGPLFVARTLEIIERASGGATGSSLLRGRNVLLAMGGLTLILFFVMIFLRRRVALGSASAESAPIRPRISGNTDDFDWLSRDPPITSAETDESDE